MSNKFNSATQILRRPKVCKTPPAVAEPAIDRKCDVRPEQITGPKNGTATFQGKANDPRFPQTATVAVETDEFLLPITNPFTINDNEWTDFIISISAEPGTYRINVIFTWADEVTTCSKPLTVIVTPE